MTTQTILHPVAETMLCPATEAVDRSKKTKLPMRSDIKIDFDTRSLFRQILAVEAPFLASFPVIEWSESLDSEPPSMIKLTKRKVSKKSKHRRSKHCMMRSKSLHQGLSCLADAPPIHTF